MPVMTRAVALRFQATDDAVPSLSPTNTSIVSRKCRSKHKQKQLAAQPITTYSESETDLVLQRQATV